jgi:hypothetical protein
VASTAEKYALEIEVLTFGSSFRAQISRKQCVNMAFSPVNIQAILANRLFQQNQSDAACRDGNLPVFS